MGRRHGEHEGYLVAYVPREWNPLSAARTAGEQEPVAVLEHYGTETSLRELGPGRGDGSCEVHGIYVVGYACTCGWRSPYRELGRAVDWSPSSVISAADPLEDILAQRWWIPHAEAAQPSSLPGLVDQVRLALALPRHAAALLLEALRAVHVNIAPLQQWVGLERAESLQVVLDELGDQLAEQLGRGRRA